jgi:hypothetical protein
VPLYPLYMKNGPDGRIYSGHSITAVYPTTLRRLPGSHSIHENKRQNLSLHLNLPTNDDALLKDRGQAPIPVWASLVAQAPKDAS